MNALAYAGAPLYALMALLELVFKLGLPLNGVIHKNVIVYESAVAAEIALENASAAAVAALLVFLGLKNSYWDIHAVSPRSLFPDILMFVMTI